MGVGTCSSVVCYLTEEDSNVNCLCITFFILYNFRPCSLVVTWFLLFKQPQLLMTLWDCHWGLWCLLQLSWGTLSSRAQCLTVKQSLLQVRLRLHEENQRKKEEETFNDSDFVPVLSELWCYVEIFLNYATVWPHILSSCLLTLSMPLLPSVSVYLPHLFCFCLRLTEDLQID